MLSFVTQTIAYAPLAVPQAVRSPLFAVRIPKKNLQGEVHASPTVVLGGVAACCVVIAVTGC
ncbi:hypothetical protein ACPV50_20755, partial [Vibrio astriarenae]